MGHSEISHGSFGDYTVYYDDDYKQVATSEERPDGTTEFRNNDAEVTGHTEKGSDLVGHETTVYYGKDGNEIGHTERGSDLVGHSINRYYGNDGGSGVSEKSSDLVGHPTTVYHGDIPGIVSKQKTGPNDAANTGSLCQRNNREQVVEKTEDPYLGGETGRRFHDPKRNISERIAVPAAKSSPRVMPWNVGQGDALSRRHPEHLKTIETANENEPEQRLGRGSGVFKTAGLVVLGLGLIGSLLSDDKK